MSKICDRRSFAQLRYGLSCKHQQKTCIYLRLSTECEVQLFTINSKLPSVLCMKMCCRMRVINLIFIYFSLNFGCNGSAGYAAAASGISHILQEEGGR